MFSVEEDNIQIGKQIAKVEQEFLKDKLSDTDRLELIFRRHEIFAEDVMYKIRDEENNKLRI